MKREPFKFLRLIFVIATLTPLFVMWTIKGSAVIPNSILILSSAAIIIISNGIIFFRWHIAIKQKQIVEAIVQKSTDHTEHLVVYLLAVFLAIYSSTTGTMREVFATLFAVALIILLFWFSRLHYLNLVFATMGYKTFTVTRKHPDNNFNKTTKVVVLSKRDQINPEEKITCYRLSHDLWIEK
jgi:hypothetical protein